jgi:hypothetical protein
MYDLFSMIESFMEPECNGRDGYIKPKSKAPSRRGMNHEVDI